MGEESEQHERSVIYKFIFEKVCDALRSAPPSWWGSGCSECGDNLSISTEWVARYRSPVIHTRSTPLHPFLINFCLFLLLSSLGSDRLLIAGLLFTSMIAAEQAATIE